MFHTLLLVYFVPSSAHRSETTFHSQQIHDVGRQCVKGTVFTTKSIQWVNGFHKVFFFPRNNHSFITKPGQCSSGGFTAPVKWTQLRTDCNQLGRKVLYREVLEQLGFLQIWDRGFEKQNVQCCQLIVSGNLAKHLTSAQVVFFPFCFTKNNVFFTFNLYIHKTKKDC